MSGNLLPSPDLAAPTLAGLTPAQRVQVWSDLVRANEQLVLAGLRREVGGGGDLTAAFRQWYARTMIEHDRTMRHLVDEFQRRWRRHGS